MKNYALGIIAVLILMSGSAIAGSDSANSPPNRGERNAPTPEALAACQNQSEGAQVVITTPRGDKLKAVCRLMDGKLVAFPAGPPPDRRGPRGPSPEALAACQNQSEGAQVVIATPRGDKLKAVCRLMDGKLVAFPEGTPPDRRMPPPPGSGQSFREPPSQ